MKCDTKTKRKATIWRLHLQPLIKLLSLFLLISFLVLDPWEMTAASNEMSKNALNVFLSPWYPPEGQEDITVILIDDTSLESFNESWPPTYHLQSTLIKEIISYKPRGVFIDFLYSSDHSTPEDTIEQLAFDIPPLADVFNVPIFLAKTDSSWKNTPQLIKENFEFLNVSWSQENNYYPLEISTNIDGVNHTEVTPATKLYSIFCQSNHSSCPKTFDKIKDHKVMSIRWGVMVPSFNQKFKEYTKSCLSGSYDTKPVEGITNSTLNKLGLSYLLVKNQLFWKASSKVFQDCYYTQTINAAALFSSSEKVKMLLQSILTDKLVLVGAKINSAPDLHNSVIHGQIPGVFYHAMALDNLISLNGEYIVKAKSIIPPHKSFPSLTILELLEIIFLLLVSIYIYGSRLKEKRFRLLKNKKHTGKIKKTYYKFHNILYLTTSSKVYTLIIFLVLTYISILFLHFKYEASNWLAVVAITILFIRKINSFKRKTNSLIELSLIPIIKLKDAIATGRK